MFFNNIYLSLGLAGAVLAAPTNDNLHRRAVVDHDSLKPIGTRTVANAAGDLIIKFNPSIHIASGCQVYTAVDDYGNTSGGLGPGGKSAGSCGDTSMGQVYARIGTSNGKTAIMYSWYWPKDQLMDYITTGAHRHDWENVVIWVDDSTDPSNPTILGGAASGHGEYKITSGALPGGNTPQVEYFASFPTNHELQFTNTGGNTLPISDWDAMPQDERNALQWTDFGSANVPFKDGNFESNLANAALP